MIHLAARVHILHDTDEASTLYEETNSLGTLCLARAAAESGVRRFIYLSSVKVNGEETDGRAFAAADEPRPRDAYARSKWRAESHIREVGAATGMETVIVRPPLVYGPGVRANFLRLLGWVERGWPLPLGAIRNRRSLVSVWNLCDLLMGLVGNVRGDGETWLVSDGDDLSTPELVRRIGAAMRKRVTLLPVPAPILLASAALLGRRAEVARLCGSLVVDLAHARRPRLDPAADGRRRPRTYGGVVSRHDCCRRERDSRQVRRANVLFAVTIAACFVSFAVTWYARRYALRRGLLDHPNERSSHELPTPRGAGIAIAIAFLAGLPVLWWQGALSDDLFAALFGAGSWTALVGFVDDHRHVPAHWRLVAHGCAAAWLLFWLGPLPPLVVVGVAIGPGWVAAAAAAVYIVWVLNLYNFMDGIDGIASIEAIAVCIGGGLLVLALFPRLDAMGRFATFARRGDRIPLLELSARAGVHGRCGQRFPRRDFGRVRRSFNSLRAAVLLGMDDSARSFHRRRDYDTIAPVVAAGAVGEGSSQPRVSIRVAPSGTRDGEPHRRRPQHCSGCSRWLYSSRWAPLTRCGGGPTALGMRRWCSPRSC